MSAPLRDLPAALRRAGAPVVLALPWVCLAHDNHRHIAARGRLIANPAYRRTKDAATLALMGLHTGGPLAGPVRLDVALYEPDRRRRDVANYAKLLGDALTAAGVLDDDSQIADARYWRAGIDRANARAVLTLTPL